MRSGRQVPNKLAWEIYAHANQFCLNLQEMLHFPELGIEGPPGPNLKLSEQEYDMVHEDLYTHGYALVELLRQHFPGDDDVCYTQLTEDF